MFPRYSNFRRIDNPNSDDQLAFVDETTGFWKWRKTRTRKIYLGSVSGINSDGCKYQYEAWIFVDTNKIAKWMTKNIVKVYDNKKLFN